MLNVDQIKEGVKAWYPTAFDGMSYKKLERALSMNGKDYLEEIQFVRLMEEALTKGNDTSQISNVSQSLKKVKPPGDSKPANVASQ